MSVWVCKIGEVDRKKLPNGCDGPMRKAIVKAYTKLTGKEPDFIFSGWGGKLDHIERSVADNTPEWTRDNKVLRDLLGLAGVNIPLQTVKRFTDTQAFDSEEWASAVHLEASDNDVEIPMRPDCIPDSWLS